MKAQLRSFMLSLMSRKFLITVLGIAAFWSVKQYDQMLILMLGYVGIQGGTDLVARYKSGTLNALDVQNVMSQNEESPVDQSKVVSGKDMPLFDESPTDK